MNALRPNTPGMPRDANHPKTPLVAWTAAHILTETPYYYSPSFPTLRGSHCPSSSTSPLHSQPPNPAHYSSSSSAPSTLRAPSPASTPSPSPLSDPSRLSSPQAGSSFPPPAAHRSSAASARSCRGLWRRRRRAAGTVSRGG